jgi:hypothetical protein
MYLSANSHCAGSYVSGHREMTSLHRYIQHTINKIIVRHSGGARRLRETGIVIRVRENSRQRIDFQYVRFPCRVKAHINA